MNHLDLIFIYFATSVASAIAGNGFTLGDTLLVKYGYGGTQSVQWKTLVNSIGNIYSVAISDFPFNADLGLYYQYYRVKNGVQYRETYFNFAYTGDDTARRASLYSIYRSN